MSIYNSLDLFHKKPFGAVPAGCAITFTLSVPKEFGCTTPYLIWHKDGQDQQMILMTLDGGDKQNDWFRAVFTPCEPGLYFYFFDLYTGYRKLFRGRLGEAYITTGDGAQWQLTCYDPAFQTPKEIKGGVIYQIFPDRFNEGVPGKVMPFADRIYRADKDGEPYFWPNEQVDGYLNMDYYGGDLQGIRQKLSYLANLGVTVIYLNPIFEAHSNHRYNTANYRKIDPLLGNVQDFRALCRDAKSYGIRIILDGVFSHTGSDSIYFNREGRYPQPGAWQDVHSPYRSWYDFSPNYACGYRSWWGFESLPEVNEEDPSYREFITGEGGVIDYWLDQGASGFRLDVADELPDDFIEAIRKAVKRHGEDKYLLGEVWEDATNKWSYGVRRTYLLGKGLDSVMNYPFKEAILRFVKGGDGADLAECVTGICENYPKPAVDTLMNFVSTHDTVRAITAIAGEEVGNHDRYWQSGQRLSAQQYEYGRRKLVLAYALVFTLPGVPSIYYGDEIGMQGYKDPFNRAFFDWNSRENRIRAALQKLAAVRRNCSAFTDGLFLPLQCEQGVVLFARDNGRDRAEVCVNRNANDVTVTMFGQTVTVAAYDFVVRTGPSAL